MSRAGDVLRGIVRRVRRGNTRPSEPAAVEVPRSASVPEDELALEVDVPVPGSLLIDIREPGEFASGVAEGALLLPMNLVPHHLGDLPRDRPLTVYCAAGARSFGVAHWLREQGFPQAYSLAGGIGVFAAVGHRVAVPPGIVPGTRIAVPPSSTVEGRPVGEELWGEVIQQRGETVVVVVTDRQGFLVRVEMQVPKEA